MQLTLSRSAVARPAATRKSAVVVRAEMRKNDLLRNFLPSEDNMP